MLTPLFRILLEVSLNQAAIDAATVLFRSRLVFFKDGNHTGRVTWAGTSCHAIGFSEAVLTPLFRILLEISLN